MSCDGIPNNQRDAGMKRWFTRCGFHRALLVCALPFFASCGVGVQAGALAAWAVLGGGPSGDAELAEEEVRPPVVVPPAIRPVPTGTAYAPEVFAHMRATQGAFAQAYTWKREYEEQPVVGQGHVTKVNKTDFYGALRVEVWVDMDEDGSVDAVLNFMNPDQVQILGAEEGMRVWFEGTLKRYEDRLMIAGTVMEGT